MLKFIINILLYWLDYITILISTMYWTVKRQDVLNMLRTVFSTLTVAMRYEPANAKFFATEVSNARGDNPYEQERFEIHESNAISPWLEAETSYFLQSYRPFQESQEHTEYIDIMLKWFNIF